MELLRGTKIYFLTKVETGAEGRRRRWELILFGIEYTTACVMDELVGGGDTDEERGEMH